MLLALILVGLALLWAPGYSMVTPENQGVGEITAPWLIIWLQVLLRHLPAVWAGLIIPLASLCLLAVLPWLPGAGPPDSAPRYRFSIHLAILLAMGCTLALLTFGGL